MYLVWLFFNSWFFFQRCGVFNDQVWHDFYPKIHTIISISFLFLIPIILCTIFYLSLSCVVCTKKRQEQRQAEDESPLKNTGGRSSRSGTLTKTSTNTKVGLFDFCTECCLSRFWIVYFVCRDLVSLDRLLVTTIITTKVAVTGAVWSSTICHNVSSNNAISAAAQEKSEWQAFLGYSSAQKVPALAFSVELQPVVVVGGRCFISSSTDSGISLVSGRIGSCSSSLSSVSCYYLSCWQPPHQIYIWDLLAAIYCLIIIRN